MNKIKTIAVRFAVLILTKYYSYEPVITSWEFIIENCLGYNVLFCFVVLKYFFLIIAQRIIETIQSIELEPTDYF